MWLLLFCVSSSHCRGLACDLWHFLVKLTYFLVLIHPLFPDIMHTSKRGGGGGGGGTEKLNEPVHDKLTTVNPVLSGHSKIDKTKV